MFSCEIRKLPHITKSTNTLYISMVVLDTKTQ